MLRVEIEKIFGFETEAEKQREKLHLKEKCTLEELVQELRVDNTEFPRIDALTIRRPCNL